jgi:ribosomal protein S12 methylthiotransferase accessory factor YcaO
MHPLPEGWSTPATMADSIVAEGLCLHRAGVSAIAPTGEEITGSAAGVSPGVLDRGWFELLERASTLDALRDPRRRLPSRALDGAPTGDVVASKVFPESDEPARWRFGRSNGVALHRTWKEACERAWWELTERDRVLRSWYGEGAPRRVAFDPGPLADLGPLYEWRAYTFEDEVSRAWSAGIEVAGVVGLPRSGGLPLVTGWSARPLLDDAIASAAAEATQQLAFLWGEPLPADEPAPGPSAMHHLDHLIWPGMAAHLVAWLDGGHRRYAAAPLPAASPGSVSFVDLTPTWLAGHLFVARAVCPDAEPLTFGDAPRGRHLPPALRAHPIA